jgi:hypothetical protein
MINKLLLVSTGAIWGLMAIGSINALSAQSKVAKNVKVTNSQVVKGKVTNVTTPKSVFEKLSEPFEEDLNHAHIEKSLRSLR